MKYQFIYENRKNFDISKICCIIGVKRSSYYSWLKRPISKRKQEDEFLISKIENIYEKSEKLYGTLRIHASLKQEGVICGHNRIARLKQGNGIYAKTKKKFKHQGKYTPQDNTSPNLLNREFNQEAPNQVWVSDITYILANSKWHYLCTVIDLFNNEIVGWSVDDNMRADLVVKAIQKAYQKSHPKAGLIFHSDQGIQYSSGKVRTLLKEYGFRQSMSRRGNCWDNAVAESFFHTLKTEHIQFHNYRTKEELELSIFKYIESFYNTVRLHSSLGYMSPMNYKKVKFAS